MRFNDLDTDGSGTVADELFEFVRASSLVKEQGSSVWGCYHGSTRTCRASFTDWRASKRFPFPVTH